MLHRKRKNQQRADGKADQKRRPGQRPFRISLEAVAGLVALLGYILAVSPSHRVLSYWVFFAALVLAAFGAPLPRIAAPIATFFGLLITGWVTYETIYPAQPITPTVVKQERPYLWVKGIDSYLDNLDMLAKGIVVQVALENASNVGAFNVTAESHITVTNKKSRVLPQSLTLPTKIPELIPPKGIMLIVLPDVTGMPFDETLIPLIEKKEAFLYVFGDIRYESENKTAYACNYCYFYEAKSKTFALTEFHNDCE